MPTRFYINNSLLSHHTPWFPSVRYLDYILGFWKSHGFAVWCRIAGFFPPETGNSLRFHIRIHYNLPIFKRRMALHVFQKWNQCPRICRTWADLQPYDVFRVHPMLKIISRFQLPIEHRIFFHLNKSRPQVCFKITIAVFTDIKRFIILFQFCYVSFWKFQSFQEMRFSRPSSMDKDNSLPLPNPKQIFPQPF